MSKELVMKLTVPVVVEYDPNPWRGYDHEIVSVYIGNVDVTDALNESEMQAVAKYLQDEVPYWEAGN